MSTPLDLFRRAEGYVTQHYYEDIETAKKFLEISLEDVGKGFFMCQYAHDVYCSGFRYEVVSKRWDEILDAYHDFDVDYIVLYKDKVRAEAMKIIAHTKKIEAILTTAKKIRDMSEERFKQFLFDCRKNLDLFKRLGYIGDVTKYHIALCLGLDVSKPDVHITRIANHFNKDPLSFCRDLAEETGYPVRIVDAILWRAAERGVLLLS